MCVCVCVLYVYVYIHIHIYILLSGGSMVKNLWETWVWFSGRENTLEKRRGTHSSFLAWRIPPTEEPGGVTG